MAEETFRGFEKDPEGGRSVRRRKLVGRCGSYNDLHDSHREYEKSWTRLEVKVGPGADTLVVVGDSRDEDGLCAEWTPKW